MRPVEQPRRDCDVRRRAGRGRIGFPRGGTVQIGNVIGLHDRNIGVRLADCNLDFSQFRPTRFEFEKKTAQLNMRLPASLLHAVKQRAAARGIPYTRFIREALEHALAEPRKPR